MTELQDRCDLQLCVCEWVLFQAEILPEMCGESQVISLINTDRTPACILKCQFAASSHASMLIRDKKKLFHASVSTVRSQKYLWWYRSWQPQTQQTGEKSHLVTWSFWNALHFWGGGTLQCNRNFQTAHSCPRLKSAIRDIKRVNKQDLPRRGYFHSTAVWATL